MRTPSLRALAAPTITILAAGAIVAASAGGQQTPRTLTFEGTEQPAPRDAKLIDVKPHGLSNGDQFIGAGSLRSNGRVVGRGHVVCTILDRTYKGQDCHFVLVLRDGTITADGGGLDRDLPGAPRDPDPLEDEVAVTGGTGAYEGASGTLRTRSGRLTVTLVD
jgi:hypothetical protein